MREKQKTAKNAGETKIHLQGFRFGQPISNPRIGIFSRIMALQLHGKGQVEQGPQFEHKILCRIEVVDYILCDFSKFILTSNCNSLIPNCERLGVDESWINF
jgi:hypothetical protein